MVRYAAAASWLLLSANRIGVWAVDVLPAVDVDGNNDLEPAEQPAASIGSDGDGDGDSSIGNSIVSTEPIAPDADTTSSTVWSWPDAIVKATAKEPLSDWKEYLFQDPFGANDDSVESTSAMFPRPVSDPDQLNWNDGGGGGGVRGKGWPSITCPYGGAMQVEDYGHRQCIGVGQGLCKDGWRFGISHYGDTTYLMLWREDNPAYPVVRWFPGATTLCIGEQYPNVAYLRVTYEDCLYYLIGPGAGSADNLARLKIVDDTQKYKPDDVIVKFRDGPGDQNTLLQIFASGFSRTSPDAMWYPMPCETASPSSSPSSSPSDRPSSSPSASPSSSPTANPSASPSSSPSDAPSSAPSTLAFPYELASPGECSPFNDISSSGTEIFGLGVDDYEEIDLGKIFTFYTLPVPRNRVFLSSNGYLSFLPNRDYTNFNPVPIRNPTDPNNFIAPFWTDLNPSRGGDIYYQITSTEFIAQWTNVPHFVNVGSNTFQAALSFVDGSIEFRYNGLTDDGGTVTIGLENKSGKRGLPVDVPPLDVQAILDGTTTCVKIVNLLDVSIQPSTLSASPSAEPTISVEPSVSFEPSSQATATSCLPSPVMNITVPGGDLTFTLESMPLAVFYVELRTFIRGDFGQSSEYADFFWRNSTSNETVFIGQNDGNGNECDLNYHEVVFVIPVETYNSWVQEGNGEIPIIFDASLQVDFCNPFAEAYVQFQVDEDCGTFSVAPSSSPSQSQMPTISVEPSVSPSSSPSAEPTISVEPSSEPSISSQPTATSCLPSPVMNITVPGGDLTFTLESMPLAVFYVELRTFIRGDFGQSSEYADFFWRNSTSNETVFIGRNDGGNGNDCDSNYHEVVFVIPVETYNSWVQEGNGEIPIIFDASLQVDICTPFAEAYVQFQVDEDCGTFSVAPSSSPSQSQMPTISVEPSLTPSSSPSAELTISPEPSMSSAPSSQPSQDCPLPRQSTGSGSCEGNCGGNAGDCWCDEFCLVAEDCCTDAYICEEVGCSAPAQQNSVPATSQALGAAIASPANTGDIYDGDDSSATSYFDIILEPTPNSSATIPSGAITISWYTFDGNLLREWSYPRETTLLYFSEYLAKNVPDGEYKVELKPKRGGQSRSGRVVLVRENGLEDFSTEVEGGDNGGDGGDDQ